MKSVSIKGTLRTETGKKNAKTVRREGLVPCVLYGGSENISFVADTKEFKSLVYSPDVYSIDIDLDGKVYTAVLQDVQYHPVKDHIIHADFLQLVKEKQVRVELPVFLEGSAAGVKAGGRLIRKMRKLKVRGLPADLPEHITVNVENVEVGGTVKVKEISTKGVEILTSPNTVIATVKGKKVVEVADPAAAATEKKK